jgi:hypothetical protein
MKAPLLITISLIAHTQLVSFAQSVKEEKFKLAVQEIINGFSKQDSFAVSKYINKQVGIYQLSRMGVFDRYDYLKTISFSHSTYSPELFTLSKGIKLLPLRYASLPVFDCEREIWSKRGLFVDTTRTDHLVSRICKMRNKFVPDHIPASKIHFFYDLETKSRRVILYDNNGIELVFYVSYLNRKWYLTIVD